MLDEQQQQLQPPPQESPPKRELRPRNRQPSTKPPAANRSAPHKAAVEAKRGSVAIVPHSIPRKDSVNLPVAMEVATLDELPAFEPGSVNSIAQLKQEV